MPKWNIKKNYKKVFSKRFIFFDIGSDIINSIKNYEILINNGADINVQDNNGNTALHYAILYKNYKLMELLIT